MRAVVAVLLVVGGSMLLAPGVATADQDHYEVSESWKLTNSDGEPRIVPRAEDGVVELTCHNEDQMTDWWVNDEDLVDRSWEKTDGTGVQVRPEFDGESATLRITLRCEEI
jgi:hypothetical protein